MITEKCYKKILKMAKDSSTVPSDIDAIAEELLRNISGLGKYIRMELHDFNEKERLINDIISFE